MSTNFDYLITQQMDAIGALTAQMEQVKIDFLQQVVAYTTEWYEATVKSKVQSNNEITMNLKPEEIRNMKEEIQALKADAGNIVAEVFSDRSLWWHEVQKESMFYTFMGNRAPDAMDKALRLCLGRLALIFEKYGYLKKENFTDRHPEIWREYDSSGTRRLVNGRPYYPYGVEWSPQMKQIIAQYEPLVRTAERNKIRLKELENEKKRTEAKDYWESN